MKTCLPITILLALVLATSVSAAQVGSIRLACENGATVARIDVQGPFQFTHTAEVPKDGKPDRLIVDVVGASHTWGPKEWSSLPQCSVTKLRIGQYSSKPEKVVRVVFELTKAPVYQADSDGKTITIRLTDASAKQFAAWSTGPAPTAAPVVPATVTTTTPAVKPNPAPQSVAPAVAVAPKVESKPASQPASSHSTLAQQQPVTIKPAIQPTVPAAPASKPTATTTPSVKPATVVASNENKPATPAATTPASKPTTVAPKVEAKPAPLVAANNTNAAPSSTTVPVTKPATVAPKVETKPAPAVASAPTKPAESTPKAEAKPTPTVASAPAKPVTTPSQPASKPAEVAPKVDAKPAPVVAVKPATQPTNAPAVKPAVTAETKPASPVVAQTTPKVEVKSTTPEVKPAVPATSAKPDQLAKAEQFKGPLSAPVTPAEKSAPQQTPAVASATNSAAVDKPADVKPADTQQEKPAAVDSKVPAPEKPVFAEADDATGVSTPARQTARFRRSATASARMKSSLVAEFPQRLVIKYENMGYRDPFATLIDDTRTYDTPIEKRLANVEGLRLVGILENASGDNRALFQDKRNFSYMLKAGDKVEKGYVLRVEADKVYFQIFEYGWSRTVALTFDNRD